MDNAGRVRQFQKRLQRQAWVQQYWECMSSIDNILSITAHRPFPMPEGSWKYYQEWHDVVFAHWTVPIVPLKQLLPRGLELELYEDEAWVSLVVFALNDMRLNSLPPFPYISDFYEINMRTYVTRKGKPGIYFLQLEAQKHGSNAMAKYVTQLPYVKSSISHSAGEYKSYNAKHGYSLDIQYHPQSTIGNKSVLDHWLTERYCLFHERGDEIYSHDIHHVEWPLQYVAMERFEVRYPFGDLLINGPAQLYHYSKGVNVLTWGKEKA
jgi:uncharacterized protein